MRRLVSSFGICLFLFGSRVSALAVLISDSADRQQLQQGFQNALHTQELGSTETRRSLQSLKRHLKRASNARYSYDSSLDNTASHDASAATKRKLKRTYPEPSKLADAKAVSQGFGLRKELTSISVCPSLLAYPSGQRLHQLQPYFPISRIISISLA